MSWEYDEPHLCWHARDAAGFHLCALPRTVAPKSSVRTLPIGACACVLCVGIMQEQIEANTPR